MNAKSPKDRLAWICTLAGCIIACIYVFWQTTVLQEFRPSAKNKVNSELATKIASKGDAPFVVFPSAGPPEFWTNFQDNVLRRASILQIEFLRRAFEQLFGPFCLSCCCAPPTKL
jgi:hypothetical protein